MLGRFKTWGVSLTVGLSMILGGIIVLILSKPLGALMNATIGILFLVGAGVLIIMAITLLRLPKQQEQRFYFASPILFFLIAAILIILAVVIFTTKFSSYLFIYMICGFVVFSGVLNLIVGFEGRKVNKSAYYYIFEGVVSILGATVLLFVLISFLKGDNQTIIFQMIIILIAIKVILTGISTILLGNEAKKYAFYSENINSQDKDYSSQGSIKSKKGVAVEDADFEKVDEDKGN